MIPIFLTALSLGETTCSIVESGTYSFLRISSDTTPVWVKKTSKVVLTKLREIQNFFVGLDALVFSSRTIISLIALPLLSPTPPNFQWGRTLLGMGFLNIPLLGMLGKGNQQKEKINHHLLYRVCSVALNTLFVAYMDLATPLILVSSCVNALSIGYNFYKTRRIQRMELEKTVSNPLSIEGINQEINVKMQAILSLFPNDVPLSRLPSIRNDSGDFPPFYPAFNLDILGTGICAQIDKELEELNKEEFSRSFTKGQIKERVERLIGSIQKFYTSEIIEKRKENLFKIFDQFDPSLSLILKTLLQEIIFLKIITRLESVTIGAEVYSVSQGPNRETCVVCQEPNPDSLICANGHALHKSCFENNVRETLDKLGPTHDKNIYTLKHIDHFEELFFRGGPKRFTHTSHKYIAQVASANIPSCPTCRGSLLPPRTFEIKTVKDRHYGEIKDITLTIKP